MSVLVGRLSTKRQDSSSTFVNSAKKNDIEVLLIIMLLKIFRTLQ